MERNDNQSEPVLIIAISTLILGLGSFVVWLLRLKPRAPHERPAHQIPDRQPPLEPAAGRATPTSPGVALTPRPGAQLAPAPSVQDDLARQPAPALATAPPPGPPLLDAGAKPAIPAATTHWTAPTRYLAGIGLVLAFLGLVYYSRQTLFLLIFGALIAILARPAIGFLQKRLHFSAGLAVITTYLLIAVLLFALPLLIVPNVIQAISSFLSIDWQGLVERLAGGLEQAAAQASATPLVGGLVSGPIQTLADFLQNLLAGMPETAAESVTMESMLSGLGQAVGVLVNVLGPLVSGVLSFIFLLLISLQMSLAGDQVRGWIMKLVPPRFETEINSLLDRISFVWVSFLRGQFALMVVMGLLVWLMNWLLGTPHALLLGLLAGLLEIIPSLGPTLAAVPAALLALLLGSAHFPGLNPLVFMLIVIAGYVLLNLLENQVLVPQILGDAVNLPPLIVIVGVVIAGAQAGIAGVFLVTPIIATGREIVDYLYAKISESPEVEPPEEGQPSLGDQLRGLLGQIRLPFRRTAGQA